MNKIIEHHPVTAIIHGQSPDPHPLLQRLSGRVRLYPDDDAAAPAGHPLVVLDGRALSKDEMESLAPKAAQALADRRAVLLIEATAEHKQALHDAGCMFTYLKEGCAALLIEPRFGPDGALTTSRGLCEQWTNSPEDVQGRKACFHDETGESGEPVTYAPEVPALTPEDFDGFADRVAFVCDALTSGTPMDATPPPPADVPTDTYSKTTIQVNWGYTPSGVYDKCTNYTPHTGNRVALSGNIFVNIYYDDTYTPPQQWLTVEHSGNISTGGMVKNENSGKGWSLGNYTFQLNEPIYGVIPGGGQITVNTNSPTNVNGTASYTSSSSFSVGFDGAGGTGSYTVSNSETVDITDWATITSDAGDWQMYQQNPYDGQIDWNDNKPPKGMWDGGDAASLPPLSTDGGAYDAQTVYIHAPADNTTTITPQYTYTIESLYVDHQSSCKTWWGYTGSKSITLNVSFASAYTSS